LEKTAKVYCIEWATQKRRDWKVETHEEEEEKIVGVSEEALGWSFGREYYSPEAAETP